LAVVLTVTVNNRLVLNKRNITYLDSKKGHKEGNSDCKLHDLVESKVCLDVTMILIDETKVCIADIKYDEFNKLCRDLKVMQQDLAVACASNAATEIRD
jgi:hypothetical protein